MKLQNTKYKIQIIFLMLFPFISFAAEDTSGFLPLVTCGTGNLPPCKICDIWIIADRAVHFAFYLSIPILTVILIWGGFLFLTGGDNPKKIEQGGKLIRSAIIGIIIALAGWLIVDTIIKTLADENRAFTAPWKEIRTCPDPNPLPVINAGELKKFIEKLTAIPGTYQTEEEARNALEKTFPGVPINRGPCLSALQTNCTNVVGLPKSTVNNLISLQNDCIRQIPHCQFILTGGTEAGHQTHGPGIPVVDIAPLKSKPSSEDFKQLRDLATKKGASAWCEEQGGTRKQLCDGATNHVHVQFP